MTDLGAVSGFSGSWVLLISAQKCLWEGQGDVYEKGGSKTAKGRG